MGTDKSVLPHPSGGTFASHAVERLSGVCDHVCVSGESTAVVRAEVIEDPVTYQGPAIGVAAALLYAGQNSFDACLVTPVDMPLLTREDLSQLRQCWEKERDLCCAVSAGERRLQPLVAVYPVSFQERLRDLADSEDRSLSRWFQTQAPLTITLSAESCRNVNTSKDLADGRQ
jgi:molybdopterin-guanine dinucleotide biosynthesis protein A